MSSRGEMKMSLRLIIYRLSRYARKGLEWTNVFMAEVLEQLELTIGSFRQDWGAKGFHDLLDSDRLVGELVFCRTTIVSSQFPTVNPSMMSYQTRPNAPMPTGCRSVYLYQGERTSPSRCGG